MDGSQDRLEDAVRSLAGEAADACGVEVVEIAVRRAARRVHVRVDIDRPGPTGVDVEDCRRVSRAMEAALDERDPIHGSYVLEVSSPGIDRPIRTPEDVRRNAGREIEVHTSAPVGGTRRFRGVLVGLEGQVLVLRSADAGSLIEIPWAEVAAARQALPF